MIRLGSAQDPINRITGSVLEATADPERITKARKRIPMRNQLKWAVKEGEIQAQIPVCDGPVPEAHRRAPGAQYADRNAEHLGEGVALDGTADE